MLRVAVPNKGSLSEPASRMLTEAGYRQRSHSRELVLQDLDADTEFFFLRPRDIATYVSTGQLDVGITGRDLLLDSRVDAEEVMALGFGRSTFRFAARPGTATSEQDFGGLRISTSYPGLVARHLETIGVKADVIRLDGAVETSVRLGVADVIADVVETGSTLRQAGLELVGDPLLESEAVLIQRLGAPANALVEQMKRRLNGVIVASAYVIFDYDVRTELLDAACALTPGIESPTVSPLRDAEWVAVRALVPKSDTNVAMDQLYDLGARGILVTDLHACRL
jgi:ATP phosphoribosyltransferase